MKYSLSSSFTRLAIGSLAAVVVLTMAGVAARLAGATSACAAWPLCVPTGPLEWFQVAHMAAAVVAAALITWLLIKAWREQRDEPILLPLTTVTGVLFLGQAFVGAIQVLRGFPLHLVVLHALTSVSLWLALIALVGASGLIAQDGKAFVQAPLRQRLRDFIALGKPLIVALLLVTTLGGLVAGARAWPAPSLALWTVLGGALAAAGASALNQYIDRELDQKMQRTARRPLAAGRLTPAEGLSFGIGLCLVSYYLLAGFVNFTAALLSLAGILYYVVIYSVLLKHATVQNIVIGGGAGAIPPMVGWAAATGHLSLAAWVLFLIVFMWTPPHFWALAIVRARDYERAGIPMLPVIRGESATRSQIMIYTVLLVVTTLLLPLTGTTGPIYLAAACILGGSLLVVAWRVWRGAGNQVAWTLYRWSSMYLMFIFLAIVVDAIA
jgi:protoheme IX farnesyltransferase